jgi:hypothetical protein
MKKENRELAPRSRATKPLRRLTLHRETIQGLNDPQLSGVLGGLAAHTFTGANLIEDGNTLCG